MAIGPADASVIDRGRESAGIRDDLQAAGIAEPGDYDFHCLRHTYVSMLVQSGASVKVCQTLARHADPAMTIGIDSHVGVYDLARGLDGLAHVLPRPCVSAGLTGTDPSKVISSPERPLVDPKRRSGKLIAPNSADGRASR